MGLNPAIFYKSLSWLTKKPFPPLRISFIFIFFTLEITATPAKQERLRSRDYESLRGGRHLFFCPLPTNPTNFGLPTVGKCGQKWAKVGKCGHIFVNRNASLALFIFIL